jgi:hypothetical protein
LIAAPDLPKQLYQHLLNAFDDGFHQQLLATWLAERGRLSSLTTHGES